MGGMVKVTYFRSRTDPMGIARRALECVTPVFNEGQSPSQQAIEGTFMIQDTTLPPPGVPRTNTPWRVQDIFESQVSKTPNAVAVTCLDQSLTYRDLNARANQLARYLQNLGIGLETPVALYLERSLNMVVAILGVLKAGGTYVPIDLAYPRERLNFMLEDTQAPVLLTQESLRTGLPSNFPEVVNLDSDWPRIAAESCTNLSNTAGEETAAYIIYTSGSTGKPKGVIVTHRNVVRLLKQTEHWYQFNSNDVWPLFHSYAFDVSVWELWGCLFYGGRLVIVPYLVSRSPHEFYKLLAEEKVTVLNQTPSAFRQLIWAEESAETKLDLNLRYVICAGEALELQSLRPWFDRHGDQRPQIVNKYGITETTVHSTYRVILKEDLTSGMGSVIGVPIPDLQIHLLDEDLKPVKPGSPGEIFVGGAGVARGYLNRPELTSKRFIPDPFSQAPGARLYRSGDLAQINANNEMEYLGRMDHQVKIRGFRVELGEIESALNRYPAIRESVVLALDTSTGDKRLVAYAVPVEAPPTVSELREHLHKTLPNYMIPASFMFLKTLPLTTNGKVDRRALPRPDSARPQLKTEFAAPETAAEQVLAQIWSEVLGIDTVGANDNFFELGGDSIRSIIILARAQKSGWHLNLEDIFQNPSVRSLAKCAELAKGREVFRATAPFSLISAEDRAKLPEGIVDAYPLSRLQLGMFFYNELDPLSAMYHDVFSYRISARFDAHMLEQAFNRLAGRHPLLRTSFQLAGFSQPLQLVHHHVSVPFSTEDLSAMPEPAQDQKLVDWVATEKRHPFDRGTAPLFRFHAQIRSENVFQFIISFHHACLDGWSLAAIVTEIFQDYAKLLQSANQEIAPPSIAYRDFVALEQQAIGSASSRAFWTETLRDFSPGTLPRWPKDRRAPAHEQVRGPEVKIQDDVLAGLKRLAQDSGVPLKSVLLAAHQRVMAFLYGEMDIVSGLICNGRPEAVDGEKLIGLFLNTLPLRQQLGGGTWRKLVKETFVAEQQLLPHRRFPLAAIQKLMGGRQLFETAFDFVHFHVYSSLKDLCDLQLAEGHYFEANNLTTYTTFMLDVTSTQLELHIDYNPNEICQRQAEQFTAYYVETLRAMAADPDRTYENFSPLSEMERKTILADWNTTEEACLTSQRIHELFEERAKEMPDRVALAFQDRQLTFKELDQSAQRVAEYLRGLGLRSQELVAICIERSPEMVSGLLGILKAGGAYVPLDPSYPRDRLACMIEDSKARLILTQTALLSTLPPTLAQSLCIETILSRRGALCGRDGNLQISPARNASQAVDSSALAYVIYTSGSTGKPKGVQVTHRSVVNLLASVARKTEFNPSDNFLAVTTLSFDIAALELFLPLTTGGKLTLASREIAGDGTRLASLMEASGATFMQGTPATWKLLIEAGWAGNQHATLFCGGEALTRKLSDQLLERSKALWNFYGPTETTIWSTAWKVAAAEPISIGRPLANTKLYILNHQLHPVPVGTTGELYIGGDGVARGYLNRDDLSSERFIPNPFADRSGQRLYKTGDLARYWPDGQVECLGRIDDQVKVRGFRIELGEVESVLRQHSTIADALVTARDDNFGEKRLIAYIISKNGPPSTAMLREFIQTRLPAYMVPAQFVPLKQFPLTPNGKIDRRQLPAPEASYQPARTRVAPTNSDERHVVAIWQEVLSNNQISIDDNFFELGGDSLSATRAFARLNREFGMDLSLKEILEHPTVRSLAKLLSHRKGSSPSSLTPIPRQPRVAYPS